MAKKQLLHNNFNPLGISLTEFTKQLLKNPLFSGSFIMVFGSNLANFFAYIYHVIVGRIFTPEMYGELAAALSIIGMVASAVTFFSVVIVKFISAAKSKDEREGLLVWFTSRGLIVGIIICSIFLLLTPAIGAFLHVDSKTIILLGPILFFSLLSLIFKAFLQGILRFKEAVIITNIEMIGKLIFGLFLIYLGLQVFGAILGLLLTAIVGTLIGWKYLSSYKILGKRGKSIDTKNVALYAVPILLSSLATNSLLAMDLVLVKHFFTSQDAGIYASVTTLGKVIFFGTAPVSAVMFPIVSKRHASGENYTRVFLLSLLMTLLISAPVLMLFLIIPDFAIKSIYNESYARAADYLFIYGLFVMFFTLASLVLNFYLSIGKTKLVSVVILASLLQIAGIWIFHDSLMSVLKSSLFSSLFFLTALLLYFVYETKNKNN